MTRQMRFCVLNLSLAIASISLLASPAAAVERPSFDCTRAATPTEKTICTSGKLAQLDRAIAAAFRQLKSELETIGDVLSDEQKEFLTKRDACGAGANCLASIMAARRIALALEPRRGNPRGAFIGRYKNDMGWMVVRLNAKGEYWLYGQTEDSRARWACDVGGTLGAVKRGVAEVEAGEEDNSRPLRLRMKGNVLVIAESDDPDKRLQGHTCGYRGFVEGSYRRVDKLPR